MSTTTRRLSLLLVATMFFVLLALMATFGVRSADAQGEPVGSCPPDFNLFTVEFVLEHVENPTGVASWDGNGDGYTCVKFIANDAQGGPPGEGQRVVIVDNRLPL